VIVSVCCVLVAGIHELGCIEQCTSLERLDLSKNYIYSASPLGNLTDLIYLDLSSNQLSSLGSAYCCLTVKYKKAKSLFQSSLGCQSGDAYLFL